MENIALIRVGVDSGCGGIQEPLFKEDKFEFICIPEKRQIGDLTYGSKLSKNKPQQSWVNYFPTKRFEKSSVHYDPEFETFTYGEPNTNKSSLKKLKNGDLLAFYAGLKPFENKYDDNKPTGLYLIGLFEVEKIWTKEISEFPEDDFKNNFHVKYPEIFKSDRDKLLVIKGGTGSKLFDKAHLISETICHKGRPHLVLSKKAKEYFGSFTELDSIQRSIVRWVKPNYIEKAASYLRNLQ